MAGEGSTSKGKKRRLLPVVAGAAVLAAVAVGAVLASQGDGFKTPFARETTSEYARFAQGDMAKLDTSRSDPAPATAFNDAEGRPTTLDAFEGEVTVVNLWATWCAPCVVEMPTLDALAGRYAGKGLKVVPVSLDRAADLDDAKNFIGVHDHLALWHDPKFALPSALEVKGLPATVVYDRQGREIARFTGEADWNSPEAHAFFDAALKGGGKR